ncbi:hypothetical protein D1BOALGB6SA_5461 [Olavius sp. associated proteobacterium Delta 1]|nr:hypothetical protein D1BOALGB6SA_5461 [Olavius sp. associated proteobacterium Delta 1]
MQRRNTPHRHPNILQDEIQKRTSRQNMQFRHEFIKISYL